MFIYVFIQLRMFICLKGDFYDYFLKALDFLEARRFFLRLERCGGS